MKPVSILTTMFLLASISAADAKTASDLTSSGTPEQKGQAIALELAARNAGYKDMGADIEMTLKDAGGGEAKRRFTLKVLEKPDPKSGDYSLIVFNSPADVKNTAVLSHARVGEDDEQWLYLPAMNRVKRIASANRTGAFVGSEFSFEDLTANEGRKYDWKFVGTEPCGALTCLVVEATPRDSSSAYSKRILRIDTNELRIASVDFYDRGGARIKTLTYADYKKVNDRFWRAQTWTMKNHQSKKSTVLSFQSMRIGNGYTLSDFASGKLGN
jgi:outer membrane lipoprotein-sorting protein